jgi:hypothetical protein
MARVVALLVLWVVGCAGEAVSGDGPTAGDLRLDKQLAFADTPSSRRDGLSDQRSSDGPHRDQGSPPTLTNLTLFVNLGDSIGAGYYASSGHSYRALLVKNDDLLYPVYKGRDLASRFPSIKIVDKAKSGAVTSEVVAQALSVTGNAVGNTLVVVSAGGNDFNDNVMTMADPIKAQAAAQQATANLKKMIDHFQDKAHFPGELTFVMLDVYDPTDGTGTVPGVGLSGFCATIQKWGLLIGPLVVQNLVAFDQTYATFAATSKVTLASIHTAFLGHGFHFNDPSSPHYDVTDPTLWFHTDCAHGNDRGHHEIRRLIWKALTGEP